MYTLLLVWVWVGACVCVAGCVWRAVGYARAPEHLRWDLYPVAHEPRREHGGSYLEQKDWWDQPRAKSRWGEVSVMLEEILLLKGVWLNNRRVWWGSLPLHWGLYLLLLTTLGIVPAAGGFAPGPWATMLAAAGTVGGGLAGLGALVLLAVRSTDRRLRPYTTPLDRLNLALLALLGGLSAGVAASPAGMGQVTQAVGQIARLDPPEVSPVLGLQMAVAALFLFYLPFTRMVHFFSKYFTFHQVRWDDRPVRAGSPLEKRLREALNFGVAWSADHLQTGRTWAEVATNLPEDAQKDGD